MYFITDWAKRVDFDAMRAYRIQRAREQMARDNLDALVLFKAENVRYVGGFRGLWWPTLRMISVAVLSRESPDPVCFIPAQDYGHRKTTMYWIKPENLRPLPPLENQFLAERGLPPVAKAVEEFGAAGGRIGVDAGTWLVLDTLRRLLPNAEFVDGDTTMREARVIKSQDEILCMRMSSECVDAAFDATIKAVDVGRRECEIMGESMRAFYSLGMETWQCSSIVSSGTNLEPFCRFPSDRMVREGDLVFMDIGGCFNGMFAEATRTVVAGRPNQQQKAIYRAVHQSVEAALAAMKPGATSDDVVGAINGVFEKHGFGDHIHPGAYGHSIGTSGWEPPVMGPSTSNGGVFTLEADMVFSIEPTLRVPNVPGGGCVRLENAVLVTPSGGELLTHVRYDARLMDW